MADPATECQQAVVRLCQAIPGWTLDIFDDLRETTPPQYCTIGSEDWVPVRQTGCADGVVIVIGLEFWGDEPGRGSTKVVMWKVIDAIRALDRDHAALETTLPSHALTQISWEVGRLDRDPNGLTIHGLLNIGFEVELADP